MLGYVAIVHIYFGFFLVFSFKARRGLGKKNKSGKGKKNKNDKAKKNRRKHSRTV